MLLKVYRVHQVGIYRSRRSGMPFTDWTSFMYMSHIICDMYSLALLNWHLITQERGTTKKRLNDLCSALSGLCSRRATGL